MSAATLDQAGSEQPMPIGFDPASYDLEVVDVRQYAEPLTTDQGTFWFDEWSVLNNSNDLVTRYREVTGISSCQKDDLSIAIGTPWLTTEDGHNFRTLRWYMGAGISGRLIGPPRIWQKGGNLLSSIQGTTEAASHVELGADVMAYMHILDAQDQQGKFRFSLRPAEVVYHGESRGAMMGFGLQSAAELVGWQIHASELIDPCMATPTLIKDIANIKNVPKILGELSTVGNLLGGILFEKRRKHYHKTFDPSLEYIIPAIATWNALTNGQAGQMALSMPWDTIANVTHYTSSVANDQEEYRRILENFEGVSIYYEDGGHLALAERQALYRPIGRLLVAQTQVKDFGFVRNPTLMKSSTPYAA